MMRQSQVLCEHQEHTHEFVWQGQPSASLGKGTGFARRNQPNMAYTELLVPLIHPTYCTI